MYSNSATYLGGVNNARPGASQYGQSFSQAGQQQQLSNGFAPGAPLQQQYTGFPSQNQQQNLQAPQQQQQPQYTGYPQQFSQASASHGPQQQQQQQYQTGQPQQQHQQFTPQKTGQTSSQIAASFSSTPAQTSGASQQPASGTKIPKIRLSFLTATDQAKFEQLFKSAVGDGQALDGITTHQKMQVKLTVCRRKG